MFKIHFNFIIQILLLLAIIVTSTILQANTESVVYHLTIDEKTVNFSGKAKIALAVNNQIPAPTLEFTEGQTAVIYVHNKLDTETSIHWHGLLLPNLQDGVPYLTTPAILPGTTYKFEFPLKHSGTYWYHSHTALQEQQGVYGAIIIQPKKASTLDYDHDLTVVLSDWTDEHPNEVLRNLKRDNEWYNIKRKTGQPLINSIKKGLLNERWTLYKKRMPDMHIADIYFDAFLSNGQKQASYTQFKPNEKVRVRFVNAGASTYFWLNAKDKLNVVSADGVDVEPTDVDKLLIAIAETYDVIVTIPEDGQLEIKAWSMDGAGSTSIYLGEGNIIHAPDIEKPDYYNLMKKVAVLHNGAHKGHLLKPYVKLIPPLSTENAGIDEEDEDDEIDHSMHQNMQKHGMDNMQKHGMNNMSEPNVSTDFSYDFLKSKVKTTLPKNKVVREIMLNLDANMLRYIWTINGKPLYEDDKILIKKGEVVRIIMNNKTMMHHPMHLHGHFFRVLNKNGDYSPLKHTVDVPAFESITIEFDANEQGDWFFHCHVLYHMKAGMARVFSYGTPRHESLKDFPYQKLLNGGKGYTHWADAQLESHQFSAEYKASSIYNEFSAEVEYGWNENIEAEFSYERYTGKHSRWFVGVNAENEIEDSVDEIETVAIAGFRYLLLSILDTEIQIDHLLRASIELDLHLELTDRLSLIADYEWQNDFNLTNSLENGRNYEAEHTITTGFQYVISKDASLSVSYDNRFGIGAGLLWRF